MKQSVILTIRGRVQGVGFRYFAMQKADLLKITGFVKNQYDGSVYVEAEGEPEQLEQFISFCKQGPWAARVYDVEIQFCPLQGFSTFEKH